MTHATRSDAELLRCSCAECKAETAYRDGIRSGKVSPPAGRSGPFDNVKLPWGPTSSGWKPFGVAAKDLPLRLLSEAVRQCPIEDALNESSIHE